MRPHEMCQARHSSEAARRRANLQFRVEPRQDAPHHGRRCRAEHHRASWQFKQCSGCTRTRGVGCTCLGQVIAGLEGMPCARPSERHGARFDGSATGPFALAADRACLLRGAPLPCEPLPKTLSQAPPTARRSEMPSPAPRSSRCTWTAGGLQYRDLRSSWRPPHPTQRSSTLERESAPSSTS